MLTIRPEMPEDIDSIYRVNEQAFGQKEEAELIDRLRRRGVLTLSLVAVQNGEVVGHIAFSTVEIESKGSSFKAISLAPIAVLPAYQKQGIGAQLIRNGLKRCHKLGYEIVVVMGYPEYYPRFGFVTAKPKGISCEFEVPDEAFMVLELQKRALVGRGGMVRFQPEFHDAM